MWTVCTKEVEEDGVCCCSERLSAENGSTCICGCCYDARTLYAVSCIVNAATVVDRFYCQFGTCTDRRLQKKSVIADAFLFFGWRLAETSSC